MYILGNVTVLQKILPNIKATYGCSFVNLRQIFTIFEILVNNDIVGRSHYFGCHGNHFGRKFCVTIVTKISILLNWLVHGEYRVYTTM